jgi:DNA-binding transcriptional MerR regulator
VAKKIYYKIGEACKLVDIQPYVLRYWETEFPFLVPKKSRSGQRVFGEREMEIIRRIKALLYDEGYTIAGAKKKLESELADGGTLGGDEEKAPDSKKAVDTEADSKVETLRAGVEGALKQAREILGMLEAT